MANMLDKEIKKVRSKEEARQVGISFQQWASNRDLSYGELSFYQDKLYKMARKYGLVREFRENGVI